MGLLLFLGVFIFLLSPILSPFLLGALLAFLGDPLVDRLEARGFSRGGGVAVVFLLFAVALGLLLSVFIPILLSQLDQLVRNIPAIYQWLGQDVLPWLQRQFSTSPIKLPAIDWETQLAEHWQSMGRLTASTLARITDSGLAFIGGLFNLAIVPVVAFYLMRDWDVMVEAMLDLVPRPWQENISLMVGEADDVLGAFIRGQFLVMVAQAVLYSVGLWLVGLQFAFILGTVAGLASIIPYAGAVIGVGASLIVVWIQYGWELTPYLLVAGVFGIGQLLEGWVLTPLLVGDRIGLHPVAVIFALMAGAQLAGFTGMLIALPVAAVLLVFVRHGVNYYRQSDAYQRDHE